MPEIRDYMSGEILCMVKKAFRCFKLINIPFIGPKIKSNLLKVLDKCAPQKINVNHAIKLIQASDICAVGERVCNPLHNDVEFGESVFLDELAEGMIEAGKAKHVRKDMAIETISRENRYPIMITSVSGKYLEICRSIPQKCIYWNSEKHGVKCITRKTESNKP